MTEQHTRLALLIDTHVREMLAHDGSDEALRMAIVNDMGPCKQWLETCTDADMDGLCERYDGLYCCAILLEQVTEGIAKGCIPVPGMQGNRCMTADALHTLRSWLSLSRSVSERSVDLSHALRMKLTSTGCLWPLVMPNGPGFQK